MWPTSPAKPWAPTARRPPMTNPPPMPVPIVTMTTSPAPTAAPKTCSAQQAAVASFTTTVVDPGGRCSASAARKSKPSTPCRLGEKWARPRRSTIPGQPTPSGGAGPRGKVPPLPSGPDTSAAAAKTAATTSMGSVGVGRLHWASTSPVGPSLTASTLDPPMSTPTQGALNVAPGATSGLLFQAGKALQRHGGGRGDVERVDTGCHRDPHRAGLSQHLLAQTGGLVADGQGHPGPLELGRSRPDRLGVAGRGERQQHEAPLSQGLQRRGPRRQPGERYPEHVAHRHPHAATVQGVGAAGV